MMENDNLNYKNNNSIIKKIFYIYSNSIFEINSLKNISNILLENNS